MNESTVTVKYINQPEEHYIQIGLTSNWDSFTPGQFVMLMPPKNATFLRRPFGIVKLENGTIELCIKVIGQGTSAIAHLKTGDTIQVFGPLGNGFTTSLQEKNIVIVAGGYGIAPLLPLASIMKNQGKNVVFYYGARTKSDLLYLNQISSLKIPLNTSTEDGSMGHKGLITTQLKKDLSSMNDIFIYAAGPNAMLHEVAKISEHYKIRAEVSLERYMACGMGVCLGCMIKMKNSEMKRACADGPVFNANDVNWE